jgi:hypothetical protein
MEVMQMAQLNTRLVLRNDTADKWSTADVNSDLVLLKGEVGIEYDTAGKVKMKVGDGTTNWSNLAYFGGEEAKVFQVNSYDALPTEDVAIGDTGIVKTLIHGDKYSYTGYVYTEQGWAAMDGNYNAENVYFDDDILVTTKIGTIQTLTNGQATLSAKGKNLMSVLSSLMAEKKNPTATVPSGTVELTNNSNKNYLVEIGTSVTPSWKTTFSAGSYTYGPATGSTATAATVSLSTNAANKTDIAAGTMHNKTGSLSAFTVADDTKHYVKVVYGWTAGTNTPVNNFGDEYTDTSKNLPIQAASNKSDTSTYYIQGYRKAFHGSKASPVELTSANIRQLAGNAATDSTLTVTVVDGAKQVIIAVPANRKVTKVADEAAFGTDIFEKFTSKTVSVGGADATATAIGSYATNYTVYTYTPSAALGANTYTVTLANA